MDKIKVIVLKEWAEVFRNRFVLFAVAFLPLIFTALPLGILYAMRSSGDLAGEIPFDGPQGFLELCKGLDGGDCMQFFIISQFMLLFMMLPVFIPITIAAYSIVGEKTTRTLEPVLATPITTLELLTGKALAGIIPAMVASWAGFLIFAGGTRLLTGGPEVSAKLFDPLWLLAVFLVGPLLAVAAVSVAVMVSSRTNDPRVAEQLSMLVLLPLLGLFFGQMTGYILLNETLILWMALGLVVIDAGLLYFATQLFQRETILTRWK
jgi:ABC-2 type transport system permease protein